MKNRLWIIFLISVILMSSATACSRSFSKAPVPSSTATSSIPFPTPSTPLPSSIINNALAGTQTAQALANPTQVTGGGTPAAGATVPAQSTDTSVPASPTATKVVPTMVPIPSATPGKPTTYTLQEGEYPFCIARRFDVNPGDLLALNNLNSNSHPAAGTVLQIPQTGSWVGGDRALIAHPTTYTVAAGDTIYSLACTFGDVDPNNIIIANALTSPYTLTAGQVINIP